MLLELCRDVDLVDRHIITSLALASSCTLTDGVGLLVGSRSDKDALVGRLASIGGSASLIINGELISSLLCVINYESSVAIPARLIKFDCLPSVLRSLRCVVARLCSVGISICCSWLSGLIRLTAIGLASSLNRALHLVLSEAEREVQFK